MACAIGHCRASTSEHRSRHTRTHTYKTQVLDTSLLDAARTSSGHPKAQLRHSTATHACRRRKYKARTRYASIRASIRAPSIRCLRWLITCSAGARHPPSAYTMPCWGIRSPPQRNEVHLPCRRFFTREIRPGEKLVIEATKKNHKEMMMRR